MRIALTVDPELPVPPRHYGGIERIVDMLARTLAARGHAVTLFSNAASTCPVERIAWLGPSSGSRGDTLRNTMQLARAVLGRRFDIVHSFSRLAYLLPLLPMPVPKLMSYQRQISPRTTQGAHRLSRGTLEFTAISRQMIDVAPLVGRWHLVPNGVPLPAYTFKEHVEADAPLVFLGRVEEIKGPHIAIEVARNLGRRLVIAGNIPREHEGWFDRHIAPHIDQDRVRYVGAVDDAQKNSLLGSARALLMPIQWEEPFGIVMAEAMACGTPVVGLRRGAVPEVVEHGVTGFVVDTVEEMMAAVGKLDYVQRRACRARVAQRYGEDAVVDAYEHVYRGMLARHARAAMATRPVG